MSRVVGLLRTEDPVVLRLTEQPAAALRVADAPVRLALAADARTLLVTDRQGPPGPAGARGPAAPFGYGDITYTERTVGPEDSFPANERKRLIFTPDPALTARQLAPPFDAHEFWVENKIMGRALYDRLAVQVNLIVTSEQAEGKLRLTADVGSALGQPVGATSQFLFNAPNDPERVTLPLRIRTLAGMLTNGAALWLTSTVPILVLSETVWIAPESVYP